MAIEITKRPFERVFSGNPVHYELYSALAAADATVFFEVRIMFKKIGSLYTYGEVVSLPYAPVDGYATIDLKEILDSVLEFDLPQFDADETKAYHTDKQTGKFYLQFREITATNANPDWDDSESAYERFVIKGGLNDFKYQGNNFWLNFYDAVKPFLTWQTSGTRQMADGRTEPVRLAAAEERMYLAWLISTSVSGISLKARIFYTDGTAATKIVQFGLLAVPVIGNIYYLPVGCNQLGLTDVTPAKSIYYWTLQVMDVNDNSTYSEVFKYELDNRNDYIGITLTYRNSLGGLDSVRVRGSVEKKLTYNFSELEKTIEPDYFSGNYFNPQKIISGNIEQVVYSGNLGLVRKEEQDRLRDAQMIRETWTTRGRKWVPLNITTKDFSLVKNDDQRWSMPVEFTLGFTGSEYYTPDSIDLGEGVFTSNVCRAFASPLTVGRNDVGAPGDWILNVGENDPENASAQFRYRVIKNSDTSVAIDWTSVDWGLLAPFSLTDDTGVYTVEVQAICTNNVYGRKSTVQIDTTVGALGGGGGGGTGGGTVNSYVDNRTGFSGQVEVDINTGDWLDDVWTGAGNTQPFHVDVNPVSNAVIRAVLPDFAPSWVTVESGGITYNPDSNVGLAWNFSHVNIVDGIRVILQ